jgi:hypothetical protein
MLVLGPLVYKYIFDIQLLYLLVQLSITQSSGVYCI